MSLQPGWSLLLGLNLATSTKLRPPLRSPRSPPGVQNERMEGRTEDLHPPLGDNYLHPKGQSSPLGVKGGSYIGARLKTVLCFLPGRVVTGRKAGGPQSHRGHSTRSKVCNLEPILRLLNLQLQR
jgi:hypothetical protein